jgi:predicted metal-dependent peptidase
MDKQFLREKVQLMLERPFYGSLVVRLQLKTWTHEEQIQKTGMVMPPTFATDGEYIYIPEKHSWSSDEIKTILAHETLHCAFQHVFRCGDKDPRVWNLAADYVVNYILQQDHFTIPKDGCLDPKYANMHAEQVYGKLVSQMQQQKQGGQGQGQEQQQQQKPGQGQQATDLLKPNTGKGKQDSKEAQAKAEELAQEWKEYLAHAVDAAKKQGNLPSGMKELIDDLLFPKLSWDNILYKWLQATKGSTDFTAYPFDRRHIYREVFLPSMTGESIEMNAALDSSGSITKQDLTRWFSELKGVCSIFGDYLIHVWVCDAAIHQEFDVTAETDLPNFALGRGGTSFVPVFDRIKELEYTELPTVYFTDLEGEFPKEKFNNVFWIVQKGNKGKVPFGEVIEIDEDVKKGR